MVWLDLTLSTKGEELMPHDTRRHSARILAFLLTCAAAAPASAQTDEQLIRALDSTLLAAVAARDTVRIGTFYVTEAVGSYPNEPVARGVPAIIHSYAGLVIMPAVRLTSSPSTITIAKSGDFATETGMYHLTFNTVEGPVVDSGSYVEVLQKVNGQWKRTNEIVTSSVPMPTMAASDTAALMGMT